MVGGGGGVVAETRVSSAHVSAILVERVVVRAGGLHREREHARLVRAAHLRCPEGLCSRAVVALHVQPATLGTSGPLVEDADEHGAAAGDGAPEPANGANDFSDAVLEEREDEPRDDGAVVAQHGKVVRVCGDDTRQTHFFFEEGLELFELVRM